MQSIFLSFSSFIKELKQNSLQNTSISEIHINLFNTLFETNLKVNNSELLLCNRSLSLLNNISEHDLEHLSFLEKMVERETDLPKSEVLLKSIQIVYESLCNLENNSFLFLPIILSMSENNIFILSKIVQAKRSKVSLGVNYFSLSSEETSLRQIDPYFLKEHLGQLYLIGFCHKHKEIRTFLISRIKGITETYNHFEPPRKASEEELFKYSLGIYLGNTGAQWIELKCKNHLLQIIKSHPIHKNQKISLDSTHFFTVKCQLIITDELKRKLLQYGADVEVLYPKSLTNLLIEESILIQNMYE